MNTFVMPQFIYCTRIWMFHNRLAQKKLNKIHERALSIAYKDSCPCFEDLLKKAESASINQRNLKLLATEIFKLKAISILVSGNKFSFRNMQLTTFVVAEIFYTETKHNGDGTESACFLGSRIWHAMPSSIKESKTLNNFKRRILSYDVDCSCKLWGLYIGKLRFL